MALVFIDLCRKGIDVLQGKLPHVLANELLFLRQFEIHNAPFMIRDGIGDPGSRKPTLHTGGHVLIDQHETIQILRLRLFPQRLNEKPVVSRRLIHVDPA
jgi:hypothetical protein